jgi:hypothetical protein
MCNVFQQPELDTGIELSDEFRQHFQPMFSTCVISGIYNDIHISEQSYDDNRIHDILENLLIIICVVISQVIV